MKKILFVIVLLLGGGHFFRGFLQFSKIFLCKLSRNLAQEMEILLHHLVHGTSIRTIMSLPCLLSRMTTLLNYVMRQTQWSIPLTSLQGQRRLFFPLRFQATSNSVSCLSSPPIIIGDTSICKVSH